MFELHFPQITWGDIIILKNGDNVALVDTGYEEKYEMLEEYLLQLDVREISFILLTHFHNDHYGCIPKLVENFNVKKVYLKEYSALDKIGSSGELADDNYRNTEQGKWLSIKKLIDDKSKYIRVEETDSIDFAGYVLKLYGAANTIREIYEDSDYEEFYHQIYFSENQNSLAAFMKVNGVNVLLGGDLFDGPYNHPRADRANYNIAKAINEQIDVYKVAHHGTVRCNNDETLDIYKPKIAIITNGEEYLSKSSTIYDDLKRVNEDIKIFITEHKHVVVKIDDDGSITCEEN